MNITNNYQLSNPNFKQIMITPNGEKALKRTHYSFAHLNDIEIAKRKYPNTRYWNFIIDGVKEYNKYMGKYVYNPIFKYVSKLTGEVFENLSICPPTDTGSGHICSSRFHKRLPSAILLFNSNPLITNAAKVKELAFDTKEHQKAESIWNKYYHSPSSAVYVYTALEELSGKYESSLKTGIGKLLRKNREYEEEVKQNLRRSNYVWFSDGGIEQWT